MASSSWFSHDSNARNSKKLIRLRQKLGAAGYGTYWMIVERLRDEDSYTSERDYDMISFDLRVPVDMIRSVIEDFGLFDISEDGASFSSHGLDERMEYANAKSEAGRKGAAKRWADKNADRMAQNGETMADYDSANGKADAIKQNKTKRNKTKDISSSLPSSSEELSDEQKEEEKFISYFTFSRNYCAPRYEYERMVAYNSTSGKKKWEDLSESEKAAVGALWHPEGESANEHKKRFPADFLKMWESFYAMLIQAGAPYDVRMASLDDNLKIVKDSGGVARLNCPKILYDWIEKPPNGKDNMEKVKPILLPYLNSHGYTTLKYQFI